MSNDLLKFAQWLDDFKQRNPDQRFASTEEALGFYNAIRAREVGNYSEVDKFVAQIPKGANGIAAPVEGNDELSAEILARAMKEEGGEYFYLVYTRGPSGAHLMDMGMKNGRRLVEVLSSFALEQNQVQQVAKFTALVSRILIEANAHIARELARRSRNN